MSKILVTGAAGFIGSWTCEALHKKGHEVIGLDNFNDYYDVHLKHARAERLKGKIRIITGDIADRGSVEKVFKENTFDQVCHLAAQAGVRYSIENPYAYEMANNIGTLNLLEACRHNGVRSFIFASSSSVYGGNKKVPFSVKDPVDKPISLYAATKKYNELLAYTYHHLYGIHCTGLRFFTVYGPWGRPDMALFKFTKAILEGKPIDVYNHGQMKRDFTFITDIVQGIVASMEKNYAYEIFNLGNSKTVELNYFIECIEKELGKTAKKNMLPLQMGDVPETSADIDWSREKLGFTPQVNIEQGINEFIAWYKEYYKIVQ
ncbi:MAG: UDP-N-acetylglucosamine 4-epimerase [Elusimicrobia bacterium]|nr:UDP-N-acetylglucosamine 4-epimerase [Elusimicrobiota bacterium]